MCTGGTGKQFPDLFSSLLKKIKWSSSCMPPPNTSTAAPQSLNCKQRIQTFYSLFYEFRWLVLKILKLRQKLVNFVSNIGILYYCSLGRCQNTKKMWYFCFHTSPLFVTNYNYLHINPKIKTVTCPESWHQTAIGTRY